MFGARSGRAADPNGPPNELRRSTEASALAARMPRLALEARRVAATVSVGNHGRRRAGSGETFWQYRPFLAEDPVSRIDWRRSARHADQLFVREREQESTHKVHLWIDRSASMDFASKEALPSKGDRAIVIGLALADCLARSGERVALAGLTRASGGRDVIDRLASALAFAAPDPEPLPGDLPLGPRDEIVLVGDFITPPDKIAEAITRLARRGVRGTLLRIIDPAEETFPFTGETCLTDVETTERLAIGDAAAFRPDYLGAMERHRVAIAMSASRLGWTTITHHTDRSAAPALLALIHGLASTAGSGR